VVDIKELKKLIKYLRAEGITEFKSGDMEFKLGQKQLKTTNKSKQVDVSEEVNIPDDGPSGEELLFWSAGGAQQETKDS
jgi:hypothetical protein